eukprot:3431182-Pyramimonas_sp.AAC.1
MRSVALGPSVYGAAKRCTGWVKRREEGGGGGGGGRRGALSLQNEDPTPQDGEEQPSKYRGGRGCDNETINCGRSTGRHCCTYTDLI